MSEQKANRPNDIDWPTFGRSDLQISYSPDGEENIFKGFKPATEHHNIRNKKRKPKKGKPREIRLISGEHCCCCCCCRCRPHIYVVAEIWLKEMLL